MGVEVSIIEPSNLGQFEAAIRKSGIGRIEDVGAVVLESDGSLSVLARSDRAYTVLGSVAR